MSGATVTPVTLPPRDAQLVDSLAHVLSEASPRLVGPDGSEVALPPEVRDVFVQVVEAMRQGQAITVAPVATRLTTGQAAELLGVSRPTLVKLLDDHEIPHERTTRHRRVRLDDLLAYRERRRVGRRSALDEMTRQAVADGLYEDDAATYSDALRRARREKAAE